MEMNRKSLNLTNDEEWAAIQPLIQKVMDARRAVGFGGMGPGGRGRPGAQASSEQQALQKAIDGGAPVAQIKDTLAKFRAARKDKQAALAAAQANLESVLNSNPHSLSRPVDFPLVLGIITSQLCSSAGRFFCGCPLQRSDSFAASSAQGKTASFHAGANLGDRFIQTDLRCGQSGNRPGVGESISAAGIPLLI